MAIISRRRALKWVENQLILMKANTNVIKISRREVKLYPFPPPGIDKVITGR